MIKLKWQFSILGLMLLVVALASGFALLRAVFDSKPRSSPLAAGQEVTLRSDYLVFDQSGGALAAYTHGTRCVVVRDLATSPETRWDQQRQIEVRIAEGAHKGETLQLSRWFFWAN